MIRSPSQWPGTARSSASAGRSLIITMSRICPVLPPRLRGRRLARRCAGSGPARGAARHGPARTGPGRWFRGSPTSSDRARTRSATGGEICTGDHQSVSQQLTWAASCGLASLQTLGRRACSRARRCARHARYRPRPPFAATSRETVETALPSRLAMTANESPACRPNVISSRSASVSLPGPGTQPSCGTGLPRRQPHNQCHALMRAADLRADLP